MTNIETPDPLHATLVPYYRADAALDILKEQLGVLDAEIAECEGRINDPAMFPSRGVANYAPKGGKGNRKSDPTPRDASEHLRLTRDPRATRDDLRAQREPMWRRYSALIIETSAIRHTLRQLPPMDAELLKRRYQPVATDGNPEPLEALAELLGVSERTLRRRLIWLRERFPRAIERMEKTALLSVYIIGGRR